MKTFYITLSYLFLATLLFNCQPEESKKENLKENTNKMDILDKHSFSNSNEVTVKHIDLILDVDFNKKVLNGSATLSLNKKSKECKKVILDTKDLDIKTVTIGDRPTKYQLHEEIPHMGSALEIQIDKYTDAITVIYQTSPSAEALQWLSPDQTGGKKHPFLFTQSQAILARSWVPCQDSPGIRLTYDAKVTVPKELLALMSADNPQEKNEEGVYTFKMAQPIPAYLFALAVGDLEFHAIGKRTGVYSEPDIAKKAIYEFGELENMLEKAEKLYGPYQWGRYDLIVLPPSFPFGGMENPKLTFATPTILAGDRSLTSLVAHELAHSWSGNLVTNATWDDFWLNEGFTVYFEQRIMEALYGKSFSEMLALINYQNLKDELEAQNYGPDTRLKLDLDGRNPDDGVTSIAYDKGYFFLRMLEENVGRDNWDSFLKNYFEEHAFKTITTEKFVDYLNKNLLSKDTSYQKVNIKEWIYESGLPQNCPKIVSKKFEEAELLAKEFISTNKVNANTTKDWSFQQWVHFLRSMPKSVDSKQMKSLDNTFHFTQSQNSEVLFEWLMLVIENNYSPAYKKLEDFLFTVGRRKFIAPLYKAMIKNESMKKMAKKVYLKSRKNYHFVSTNTIDGYFEDAGLEI